MQTDYDVVIVGGGPSGLSTALFLIARDPSLAARLVVLEKAHYPREKFCGGAIGARGERALAELGVTVDVPGAVFTRMSVSIMSGSFHTRPAHGGRVVRRIEFDAKLAENAKKRGVRILEGVKVSGLSTGDQCVTLQTSRGEITTRVVVGADGVSSVVRKTLAPRDATWRAQVLEVDTPPAAADRPRDTVHFDLSDGAFQGYAWDFPTIVRGEPLMCRGVYHLLMPGESAGEEDLEQRLGARLAALGLDLSACKKKRYAERGFAPHEAISAPRVLLVGEAAGVDPITGEGIAQAILYGQAAAPYLLARLASDNLQFRDWSRALARTSLGIDMRVRHAICRTTFGPARAFYDRWIRQNPEVMEQAALYFGGNPVDRLALLRLGAKAAGYVVFKGAGAGPFRRVALPAS